MSSNPYEALESPELSAGSLPPLPRGQYGGIGRIAYFAGGFAFSVVIGLLLYVGMVNRIRVPGSIGGPPGIVLFLSLAGLIATFALGFFRLKNLGDRRVWVLGFVVPILNILVGIRCLAAPEGFADHQRFDRAGKVIAWLLLLVFALLILVGALAGPNLAWFLRQARASWAP